MKPKTVGPIRPWWSRSDSDIAPLRPAVDASQLVAVVVSNSQGVRFHDATNLSFVGEIRTKSRYRRVKLVEKSTVALGQNSKSGYIEILDLQTLSIDRCLAGHRGCVSDLCGLGCDHSRINVVSVSHDQSVRIWDAQTGENVATLMDPGKNCLQCVCRVGNDSVAVGGGGFSRADRLVRIVNLEKGEVECLVSRVSPVPRGRRYGMVTPAVQSMASTYDLSPNVLFVGDVIGVVAMYDLRQMGEFRRFHDQLQPVTNLKLGDGPIGAIEFLVDDYRLVLCTNSSVRIHDLRGVRPQAYLYSIRKEFDPGMRSLADCCLTPISRPLSAQKGVQTSSTEFVLGCKFGLCRFDADGNVHYGEDTHNVEKVQSVSYLGSRNVPDSIALEAQQIVERLEFMMSGGVFGEGGSGIFSVNVVFQGSVLLFSVLFLEEG